MRKGVSVGANTVDTDDPNVQLFKKYVK